jgi:hypothetical protein
MTLITCADGQAVISHDVRIIDLPCICNMIGSALLTSSDRFENCKATMLLEAVGCVDRKFSSFVRDGKFLVGSLSRRDIHSSRAALTGWQLALNKYLLSVMKISVILSMYSKEISKDITKKKKKLFYKLIFFFFFFFFLRRKQNIKSLQYKIAYKIVTIQNH